MGLSERGWSSVRGGCGSGKRDWGSVRVGGAQ